MINSHARVFYLVKNWLLLSLLFTPVDHTVFGINVNLFIFKYLMKLIRFPNSTDSNSEVYYPYDIDF